MHTGFGGETFLKKKLLDVAGRVVLKWILKKCDERTL